MSSRAPLILLISGMLSYALLIGPFTSYMRSKPIEEKLGYVPSTKLLKSLSVDQKELVGASLTLKTMMYYGGIGMTQQSQAAAEQPDLQGMSRMLHAAVQLDPYNMDAYYFAQGFLTWDARQIKIANDLLEYGMKYRDWDWQLPYFSGFNYAYFLKDYNKAAECYKRAGELSGFDLHKKLASRYLQESGQTELAIGYLIGMVKSAKNQAVKKAYQVRLKAFQEARLIEVARDRFREKNGNLPASIEQLLQSGYLVQLPVDPYGGQFILESDGRVATTSKFAFSVRK